MLFAASSLGFPLLQIQSRVGKGFGGGDKRLGSSTVRQHLCFWPAADQTVVFVVVVFERANVWKVCGGTLRPSVTHTNWFCSLAWNSGSGGGGRLQVIDRWRMKTELRLKQETGQRATTGAKFCLSALGSGPQVPDWFGIRAGCELEVYQEQTELLGSVWMLVLVNLLCPMLIFPTCCSSMWKH